MARAFYFIVLLILIGAVGIFAFQNSTAITIQFLQWQAPTTLAMVAGAAYLLGMLSGWTVVGLFRRSWNRVTEVREVPRY